MYNWTQTKMVFRNVKRERLKWKSHFHFKKLVPDLRKPQIIEWVVISENRNTNLQQNYYKNSGIGVNA